MNNLGYMYGNSLASSMGRRRYSNRKKVKFTDRYGNRREFYASTKVRKGRVPPQLKKYSNNWKELAIRRNNGEFGNMKWKDIIKKYSMKKNRSRKSSRRKPVRRRKSSRRKPTSRRKSSRRKPTSRRKSSRRKRYTRRSNAGVLGDMGMYNEFVY